MSRGDAPQTGQHWRTAIIILMAGDSVRMGFPKALAQVRGEPMLAHALAAAHGCAPEKIVVVLGAEHAAVRAAVDTGSAEVVVNGDHRLGMASSLATGVRSLEAHFNRVAILLGDQPNVNAVLVQRLLDLQSGGGHDAAAVSCGGVVMAPAVISGSLIDIASRAQGDVGLRHVLRAHPELVAVLDVDPVTVLDVDTPLDLAAAQAFSA